MDLKTKQTVAQTDACIITEGCVLQIALAAAATLTELPRIASDVVRFFVLLSQQQRDRIRSLGSFTAVAILASSLLLSASRTCAILGYYGAPLKVWSELSLHEAACPSPSDFGLLLVCTGAEWYRFPSSFFLPSPRHRLAFIDSPFDGAFACTSSAVFSQAEVQTPSVAECLVCLVTCW